VGLQEKDIAESDDRKIAREIALAAKDAVVGRAVREKVARLWKRLAEKVAIGGANMRVCQPIDDRALSCYDWTRTISTLLP
jgi:hypothetical protein